MQKQQNEIQIFENKEFGKLEILMIGDKPYFPAIECAKTLGYNNAKDAIIRHCLEDGVVKHDLIDRLGRPQTKKFISEGNLYRLIVRSKLPTAIRFEKFIFDEVIPSIRKYGAYITNNTLKKMQTDDGYTKELLRQLDEERKKRDELSALVEANRLKAEYYDNVLKCTNGIRATTIAGEYDYKTKEFNLLLKAFNVIKYSGDTWVLTPEHFNNEYMVFDTICRDGKKVKIASYWTQKGRHFLYNLLKSKGILPVAERGDISAKK